MLMPRGKAPRAFPPLGLVFFQNRAFASWLRLPETGAGEAPPVCICERAQARGGGAQPVSITGRSDGTMFKLRAPVLFSRT